MTKKRDLEVRYRLARLSDSGGDLSKRWMVIYYLWSETDQKLMRCRVIIKGDTIQARQKDAAQVIKEINRLLKNGATYSKRSKEKAAPPTVDTKLTETHPAIDGKSDLLTAIDYFLTVKKQSLKANSQKTYRSSIKLFTTYLKAKRLAYIRLNQFTVTQASQFMDHILTDLRLANKSHNKHLGTYETLFNFYLQQGQIKTNPFGLICFG